jgi:hypothetical protein
MSVIAGELREFRKIHALITQNSRAEESEEILKQVTRESVQDFKCSKLWKPQYEFSSSETLLNLPGIHKMEVRVIGSGLNPKSAAIDALLSLALYNKDVLLAGKYGCCGISPYSPIGDLLALKHARTGDKSAAFWELLEISGVPDLSHSDLRQGDVFKAFNNVANGAKVTQFRNWFHGLHSHDIRDVMKEYVSILQQMPWTSKTPAKLFRFVTTAGLGLIPVVGPVLGTVAGGIDAFVVDQLFKPKSPRFFIDDLNNVAGELLASKSMKIVKIQAF